MEEAGDRSGESGKHDKVLLKTTPDENSGNVVPMTSLDERIEETVRQVLAEWRQKAKTVEKPEMNPPANKVEVASSSGAVGHQNGKPTILSATSVAEMNYLENQNEEGEMEQPEEDRKIESHHGEGEEDDPHQRGQVKEQTQEDVDGEVKEVERVEGGHRSEIRSHIASEDKSSPVSNESFPRDVDVPVTTSPPPCPEVRILSPPFNGLTPAMFGFPQDLEILHSSQEDTTGSKEKEIHVFTAEDFNNLSSSAAVFTDDLQRDGHVKVKISDKQSGVKKKETERNWPKVQQSQKCTDVVSSQRNEPLVNAPSTSAEPLLAAGGASKKRRGEGGGLQEERYSTRPAKVKAMTNIAEQAGFEKIRGYKFYDIYMKGLETKDLWDLGRKHKQETSTKATPQQPYWSLPFPFISLLEIRNLGEGVFHVSQISPQEALKKFPQLERMSVKEISDFMASCFQTVDSSNATPTEKLDCFFQVLRKLPVDRKLEHPGLLIADITEAPNDMSHLKYDLSQRPRLEEREHKLCGSPVPLQRNIFNQVNRHLKGAPKLIMTIPADHGHFLERHIVSFIDRLEESDKKQLVKLGNVIVLPEFLNAADDEGKKFKIPFRVVEQREDEVIIGGAGSFFQSFGLGPSVSCKGVYILGDFHQAVYVHVALASEKPRIRRKEYMLYKSESEIIWKRGEDMKSIDHMIKPEPSPLQSRKVIGKQKRETAKVDASNVGLSSIVGERKKQETLDSDAKGVTTNRPGPLSRKKQCKGIHTAQSSDDTVIQEENVKDTNSNQLPIDSQDPVQPTQRRVKQPVKRQLRFD